MAEFNIIIEKGEDGYLISEVIELPGCHTQGETMEELIANTKEAISLYLKVVGQEEKIRDKFIGIQKLEV
jgi:predicted RNase H-like HicB family nuclease